MNSIIAELDGNATFSSAVTSEESNVLNKPSSKQSKKMTNQMMKMRKMLLAKAQKKT